MTESALPTVEISEENYLFSLNRFVPPVENDLERKYVALWCDKSARGLFRYQFNRSAIKTTTIPLRGHEDIVNYVIQLNLDRALKKREAHEILDIRQPFDETRFNFTKIPEKEMMFKVRLKEEPLPDEDSFVAINVSPVEFGHTLIIPDLHAKLPQILTEKSLILAISIMLSIHSPDFRVGYNGLLAFASVNHLHLHGYFLKYNMHLETIPVEYLAGNCFALADFPSKGFVFQIRRNDEIRDVVRSVLTLTNFLVDRVMPHNVFITRGRCFEKSSQTAGDSGERDCLRVYIWTRQPTPGAKSRVGLHPAVCELSGHFLIKDEETFQQANESWISNLLIDLTSDYYTRICGEVKDIFSNKF